MSWLMVTILLSLSASPRPAHPELPPAVSALSPAYDVSTSVCSLAPIVQSLRDGGDWQDLSAFMRVNPEIRKALDDIMPDFQIAFLHEVSHGILLIQSTPLDQIPGDGEESERFWSEVVDETRSSCASSGVACAVKRLSGAPDGLSASTLIPQGHETYRRETLAFIGADRCSYAIQFSGPASILSPRAWKALRHRLDTLRKLVAAAHHQGN